MSACQKCHHELAAHTMNDAIACGLVDPGPSRSEEPMTPGVAVFRARRVLEGYAGPRTPQESVTDLLADLLHFCQEFGISMVDAMAAASLYHARERDRAAATRP